MTEQALTTAFQPVGLADILERVLDKGVVIVGDIHISLADVELLAIKIRLLIASVACAKSLGMDWWEHDFYSPGTMKALVGENQELRERLGRLESQIKNNGNDGKEE